MEIQIPPDLSIDDIEELPAQDGLRYELHEGNLVIMSPATLWHYRVGWRLVRYFDNAGRHAGGEVGIKDATIYQFVLDQSPDGEPSYRQAGVTTLSELERDSG